MKYYYINNIKFLYLFSLTKSTLNNFFWLYHTPVLEYLKTVGIIIPHYCYHKSLPIAGSCRACLVEIKRSPKPVASCAIITKSSLTKGVEIFTNSPLVQKSNENILEFLLLNHPLDCPICDQGGQCDLQDQSFFFGLSKKRFYGFKRVTLDKNIGPVIKTVMNRCIHCTRCVRFFSEIIGVKVLGTLSRGVKMEVGTFLASQIFSEFSGNVIDLCPVGALTAKPYFFVTRSWELKILETFDYNDCFVSKIQVFLKNNKVIKILPSYDLKNYFNGWLHNKTRFGFDVMFSNQRVLNGLLFKEKFKKTSWSNLFQEFMLILYFQDHLSRHFKSPSYFLLLLSFSINIETLNFLILLQNSFSFLKLKKIEKTKNELDFQIELQSNKAITKLWKFDLCILVDLNLRSEAPLLNLRLRQRYLKGHFKIFTFFSLLDYNYFSYFLSSDLKTLKNFCEGNNKACRFVVKAHLPIFILGSNKSNSNKNSVFTQCFRALNSCTKFKKSIQVLENRPGNNGVFNLKKVSNIALKDIKNFNTIFFLSFRLSQLQKFLELKLLGYFKLSLSKTQLFLEQNTINQSTFWHEISTTFVNYKYIYLPENLLLETTGTFLSSQGIFKQVLKCVTQSGSSKNSWQILRKLFSQIKKIENLVDFFSKYKIFYTSKNLYSFRNFVGYLNYPTGLLSVISFYSQIKTKLVRSCLPKLFDFKRKEFNSKLRKNMNDFFYDYLETYSSFSIFLLECSKAARTNYNFFKKSYGFVF